MNRIVSIDTSFGPVPILISRSARSRVISLVSRGDRVPVFQIRLPARLAFVEGIRFAQNNVHMLETFIRKHPDLPIFETSIVPKIFSMPESVNWPVLGGEIKIHVESALGSHILVCSDWNAHALFFRVPEHSSFSDFNSICRKFIARCARPILLQMTIDTAKQCALVPPVKFHCSVCSSRWGSWGERMEMLLNPLLVFAEPDTIRSVIVHELCHQIHPNHSSQFWELVSSFCPDYPSHKMALHSLMNSIHPVWKKVPRS